MGDWLFVRKRPVDLKAPRLEQRVESETREGTVVGETGDFLLVGVDRAI